MEVKYFFRLWGSERQPSDASVAKVRHEGHDRVEPSLAFDSRARRPFQILRNSLDLHISLNVGNRGVIFYRRATYPAATLYAV